MTADECFDEYAGNWTTEQTIESIQPDANGQTIVKVQVGMAKASPEDLEMGYKLCRMLDALDDGRMPDEIDPEGDGYFDIEDGDECRAALRLLLDTFDSAPGGLCRIVYGMGVLLDPKNKVVNPDSEELERYDPSQDDMEEEAERSISMSDRKAEAAERTAQGPMLMGDGLD